MQLEARSTRWETSYITPTVSYGRALFVLLCFSATRPTLSQSLAEMTEVRTLPPSLAQ